ncbi:MAG: hypothetical protein Q4Q58_00640 [Thermoplasmata archaeon]|nr:hypothetical protein [Thermoplasmata archaeon]
MVTFDPTLDETRRKLKVDSLVRQIARARMMSSIGGNDVGDLDRQIPILEDNLAFMPPDLMNEYFSSLSERDSEDEAQFVWMTGELMRHMPLLKMAARLADSRDCGLTDADDRLLIAIRSIMNICSVRTIGQDPDVVGNSLLYMGAVMVECSILLRIHSLKAVTSEEISAAVAELDRVDESDFDALFMDVLDQRERLILESFRQNTGQYVSAMYARCIINSRFPEMATVSDHPERCPPSDI